MKKLTVGISKLLTNSSLLLELFPGIEDIRIKSKGLPFLKSVQPLIHLTKLEIAALKLGKISIAH